MIAVVPSFLIPTIPNKYACKKSARLQYVRFEPFFPAKAETQTGFPLTREWAAKNP
jgi:hypothetical protein